jgi:hypothetical protein
MSEPVLSSGCSRIHQWLVAEAISNADRQLPDDLVLHISQCAHCRGMLTTLIADQLGVAKAINNQSCAFVEDQLPAFVDHEQIYGSIEAIRTYPNVWWHTLICPQCDKLYRSLATLVALPPLAWNKQPIAPHVQIGFRAQIMIHTAALRQFLTLQASFGASWGQSADGVFIGERQEESYLLQVALHPQPTGGGNLLVKIKPAILGIARLQLHRAAMQAAFDGEGNAVFPDLRAADLEEIAGADLHLVIESS